MIFYWIKDILI